MDFLQTFIFVLFDVLLLCSKVVIATSVVLIILLGFLNVAQRQGVLSWVPHVPISPVLPTSTNTAEKPSLYELNRARMEVEEGQRNSGTFSNTLDGVA